MTTQYRHIVMIGMMGVGKSTVGRLVATRLGWGYWDNDEALERRRDRRRASCSADAARPRCTPPRTGCCARLLQSHDRTVFAAAGSVVLKPELLAGELTVWLRTSLARERENIAHSGQHHRPLPEAAMAVLQRLSAARLPMYERVADITIQVADAPEATCELVMDALHERGL